MQQIYLSKNLGDNKYSNDSSVPQHPQPKLTTSIDVECQQQTQRSKLWGAEAASTAWLNGAGDFTISSAALQAQPITAGEKWRPACEPGSP